MIYIRSGITRCTIFMVLYLCRICQCLYMHAVLTSDIGMLMRLLAAGPYSTAVLLFPSQYLCRTILIIVYSMVRDCRFQEQGQCLYNGLASYSLFCLLPLSLLSFYGLVLRGWGLWSGRVCKSYTPTALHYLPYLIKIIIIVQIVLTYPACSMLNC